MVASRRAPDVAVAHGWRRHVNRGEHDPRTGIDALRAARRRGRRKDRVHIGRGYDTNGSDNVPE